MSYYVNYFMSGFSSAKKEETVSAINNTSAFYTGKTGYADNVLSKVKENTGNVSRREGRAIKRVAEKNYEQRWTQERRETNQRREAESRASSARISHDVHKYGSC